MFGFPSLGVWGALLVWGGWAPAWGSALLVSWFVYCIGKYLDPAGNGDRYGPQNPARGTKISGDRPRGLSAQGVTSDLATCGPVTRCVSARHLGQNTPSGVCGWELTSMVTLAPFGLTTGFLLGPADDRKVSPIVFSPRSRFS